MTSIYIDSALLAVPNYAVDPVTAEELIDRVSYFSVLLSQHVPINIVVYHMIDDLLWENNVGPDYSQIDEFLQIMDLRNEFSPRDILVQYNTILARAMRSDVLPFEVEQISDFEIAPPLPNGLGPKTLMDETERVFASVATLHGEFGGWKVASAIQGVERETFDLRAVAGKVSGEDADALGPPPVRIAGTVDVLAGLRGFISEDAALQIWSAASDGSDLYLAVVLGALALLETGGKGGSFKDLKRFCIGPKFFDSLSGVQCRGSGKFTSAAFSLCCQLMAGTCSHKTGPFGRPDQLIRDFDKASAWRVHLTEANEGLRLMYWESGGVIELANIGVKHELEIEKGWPKGGIALALTDLL